MTERADDNLLRAEAVRRAELVSDVSYDVTLDLTGDEHTFLSDTTITFAGGDGADGTELFLDLIANEVTAVSIDGKEVPVDDVVAGSRVRLGGLEPVGRHEVRVVARCAYEHTSKGLHRFVDPADERVYLHSQFEPFDAHRMFACFDQPDLKAPFKLTVTAPGDWEVISNSAPVGPPAASGDAKTWQFPATPRISTYLTALVAGPYHSVHESHQVAGTDQTIELGIYCRQSLAEHLDADDIFLITRQGFDFFTKSFDYPYPFGKYDQLFVPEFFAGAMENPGCVTFTESYVFRGKITELAREGRAGTILHEMAHMWFGDLVTMRWWDDLWLNESFATYMGNLSLAEGTRFTDGWARFASGTKAGAYAQDQLPSTHPISADIVDTDALKLHFDGITYNKGASVLRQLAAWVGRDAFDEALRGYFRRHEFANATLADFLEALEGPSGRSLDGWSKEWLETSGVNTFRLELQTEGDGEEERYKSVVVRQSAAADYPTLRSHRAAVGLYRLTGEGPNPRSGGFMRLDKRVELDIVGSETAVDALVGEKVAELVVVNDGDLAYAKVRLDPRSMESLVHHMSGIEDQLTRSICWGAAWDMVRDAELSTGQFVKLVSNHVAAESDLRLALQIAFQASGAVESYGDPAKVPGYRTELARTAFDLLGRTEPGSDAQNRWAALWVGSIEEAPDLQVARGWLEGKDVPQGLDVDVDLRWSIVNAVARSGADDAVTLIDAEKKRDATDIGARRALAARASRPSVEAKEEAWNLAVDNTEAPVITVRAVLGGGFHQFGQEDVLVPFVERFPEAFDKVWANREHDVATGLTAMLFPSTVIDDVTVDMADKLLGRADIDASARRVLVENKDRLERALRARNADKG
ncbi:MAG TPA: aminopeptidase N [Acidimicrobiales bacterium]|nr:aminopeptidase N [Acidimicrobiales bacterium]